MLEFYLKKSLNFKTCKTVKSNLYLSSNPTKLGHLLNLFIYFCNRFIFKNYDTRSILIS